MVEYRGAYRSQDLARRCPKLNDMDSALSASAVAEELGTSVPRVARAARRLGLDTRSGRGRFAFDPDAVRRLREELGRHKHLAGLTRPQVAVLAALFRSPLGIPSARAVALRAGISPTSASRAVRSLLDPGLIQQWPEVIAAGAPRHVLMLYANREHPRWRELVPHLRRVTAPKAQRDERVPARLDHLFWNSSPAQLEVARGGPYIARRLLRTLDPAGLSWGARNLDAEDWLQAAHARGLDPATRTLARNLAAEGQT
jgi:MarR family